jgi:hypothetical protein
MLGSKGRKERPRTQFQGFFSICFLLQLRLLQWPLFQFRDLLACRANHVFGRPAGCLLLYSLLFRVNHLPIVILVFRLLPTCLETKAFTFQIEPLPLMSMNFFSAAVLLKSTSMRILLHIFPDW